MKHSIYAVRDAKADVYARPFTQANDQLAARAFYSAAMDPSTELSKFPEDYSLWVLGYFDDESGIVEGIKPLCVVASARMPVTFQKD